MKHGRKENQNKIIDDVSEDTENTNSRLKMATKKITHMLETMSCIPYRTTGCAVILGAIIRILTLILIFG